MSQKYRMYAVLAGANFETVFYLIGAWQIEAWLSEHYYGVANWPIICFLLALLLIVRTWYVMFRSLIRWQRESTKKIVNESDETSDQS